MKHRVHKQKILLLTTTATTTTMKHTQQYMLPVNSTYNK